MSSYSITSPGHQLGSLVSPTPSRPCSLQVVESGICHRQPGFKVCSLVHYSMQLLQTLLWAQSFFLLPWAPACSAMQGVDQIYQTVITPGTSSSQTQAASFHNPASFPFSREGVKTYSRLFSSVSHCAWARVAHNRHQLITPPVLASPLSCIPTPHSVLLKIISQISSLCCCLVAKLCLTLHGPMDHTTPAFSVPHHLPEFAQAHVQWIGDPIQPSHPLSPSSPSAFNLPQHQGLFQWVSCSHQVAKVLELQLQHWSFQRVFRVDLV